jgi:membrane protein required for colicin V production
MTPTALDIAIGFIIVLSTLVAYFRGLLKEFFTLAGFALATYVSYNTGELLVPGVGKWLGVPPEGSTEKAKKIFDIVTPEIAADVVAYGGVFLLVFLLMLLLRMMFSRWIKEAGLTVIDRLLGALFGFARGFLLVFLIYVPIKYLNQNDLPDWAKNSYSVPKLQATLDWAKTHIDFDKMIEQRGNDIAIVIGKFDITKFGGKKATEELKDEIKKEENEVQKSAPETPPAPVPEPAPAPQQQNMPLAPVEQPPAPPPAQPEPTPPSNPLPPPADNNPPPVTPPHAP